MAFLSNTKCVDIYNRNELKGQELLGRKRTRIQYGQHVLTPTNVNKQDNSEKGYRCIGKHNLSLLGV